MPPHHNSPAMARQLEQCFKELEAAAVAGMRCPMNDFGAVTSGLVRKLAKAGRVRVEIYQHNYRVVTILKGESVGASTQGAPAGTKVHKVIDHSGTAYIGHRAPSGRQHQSPRPVTLARMPISDPEAGD